MAWDAEEAGSGTVDVNWPFAVGTIVVGLAGWRVDERRRRRGRERHEGAVDFLFLEDAGDADAMDSARAPVGRDCTDGRTDWPAPQLARRHADGVGERHTGAYRGTPTTRGLITETSPSMGTGMLDTCDDFAGGDGLADRHESASPVAAMDSLSGREGDHISRRPGRWWLAVCLLAACFFAGKAFLGMSVQPAVQLKPAVATENRPAARNIETIRVGQRVVAHDPQRDALPRTRGLVVDPATWRLLRLRAEDRWPDGTLDVIEVETLQPPEWVEQHGAQPGATVPLPLDLLEMGLPENLRAVVVANEPCPPIPDGPGSVVLTTVNHLNPYVFELSLTDDEGHRETVKPTGLHKFYSADRQAWVNTGELRVGERLRGLHGWLTVHGVRRLPGVHRVYNMTVAGEHVFHVSNLGLLSHNNNPCGPRSLSERIADFRENPQNWQRISASAEPATARSARGGVSIESVYQNPATGGNAPCPRCLHIFRKANPRTSDVP